MSFCGKKSAGSEDGCLTESRDLTNSTLRGETKTHSEKLSSKETQQFSNITGQGMKITATTGDSELAAQFETKKHFESRTTESGENQEFDQEVKDLDLENFKEREFFMQSVVIESGFKLEGNFKQNVTSHLSRKPQDSC